jgi:VIT1/CCC1 family predicted Fe2+/Mn2+ transporter
VAAYFASNRRIIHGTIGGAAGVLLMLVPALFVPGYPISSIPIVIATYAVLASLGAIFGNHRRNKVGP